MLDCDHIQVDFRLIIRLVLHAAFILSFAAALSVLLGVTMVSLS
jgi:hypothetical protein